MDQARYRCIASQFQTNVWETTPSTEVKEYANNVINHTAVLCS